MTNTRKDKSANTENACVPREEMFEGWSQHT